MTLGDMLNVTLSSSLPYAEYDIRKFTLKNVSTLFESILSIEMFNYHAIQLLTPDEDPLTVTQFHYTAWSDHGVPDNVMSVISFIRHVRKLYPVSLDQPLLVHCSAGVGRTGTFITLDMMMQQMKAEGTLSIHQCVRNLRTQRMRMVQTLVCANYVCHAGYFSPCMVVLVE